MRTPKILELLNAGKIDELKRQLEDEVDENMTVIEVKD